MQHSTSTYPNPDLPKARILHRGHKHALRQFGIAREALCSALVPLVEVLSNLGEVLVVELTLLPVESGMACCTLCEVILLRLDNEVICIIGSMKCQHNS